MGLLPAIQTNKFPSGVTITGGTITTDGNNLSLVPSAGKVTIIGDAGAPGTVNTNDDLYVSGRAEIESTIYAKAGINLAAGDELFGASASLIGSITGQNTAQNPDCPVITCGSTPMHWIMMDRLDRAVDWAIAQDTDPTFHICSGNGADVTSYMSLRHNQTDAELMSAKGGILLRAPAAAPTCSGNSQVSFWLDEATNDVKCVAKYSDGTAKTGTVCALV